MDIGGHMIIVITGPTAVGKTKLSIELAKLLNGEIINADSTQVYQGMNIATAKVTEQEKDNIPHHLFDIKTIDENYTIFDYQKDCRKIINDLLNQNKTPILVGGSGLYIKAALYDYQLEDEKSQNTYDEYTNEQLYQKISSLDPDINIHPNNRKRLVRALNYMETNQKKWSEQTKTDTLLYDTLFIGLTCDRNILYERINQRVDEMIDDGLLVEAKNIYDSHIQSKAVLTPIGYKELFPYFENKISLEEALNHIKQNSRRYAKRQYTWFNNQMNIKWFSVNFNHFESTIQEVYNYIKTNS